MAGGPTSSILIPGIFVQMLSFGSIGVGIKLNSDFDKGLMDRFRSLPIARVSVLTAHLVSSVLRLLLASLITLVVAVLLGFRVHTGLVDFLGGIGLLLALALRVGSACTSGTVVRSRRAVQGVLHAPGVPADVLLVRSSTAVSTMPGWLQAFVKVTPLAHSSTRYAGCSSAALPSPVRWAVFRLDVRLIAGILVVFFPLAMSASVRRT